MAVAENFLSKVLSFAKQYLPKQLQSVSSSGHIMNDFSLDLVGILAIADLDVVSVRTALQGTPSFFDSFVICPGLHRQHAAPDLAKGEYPACAAMTSGYVFRVENDATVFQLQRLGRPGHLTTLRVSHERSRNSGPDFTSSVQGLLAASSYCLAVSLCIATLAVMAISSDLWGVIALGSLILARFFNVVVLKRRAALGWKGAAEPGVEGDLIILLSHDRWIRLQGLVDDLKAVTSGQWLREPIDLESCLSSLATLLVYAGVVFCANAQRSNQVLLFVLMIISAALLGICNLLTTEYSMYGNTMVMQGQPKSYGRRLELAEELIKQTGRKDWAVRLGMVQADSDDSDKKVDQGPKIM